MRTPHALIFDMDGLLLDTELHYKRSWTQAAKEMGFDLTDELYLQLIGITVADAEIVLAQEFGIGFDKAKFHDRAAYLYEELHKKEGLPLKPGVRELLVWAKENNVPCAVGTSTVQKEAIERLKHHEIFDYFVVVIGGDMVERGKPNPDIFLKAQGELKLTADNCLVLEDAHSGLMAARAGGMRSCLVPDLLPASDESRSIAEGVFESLHHVREWLAQGCPIPEKAHS
ncbi:MAG: HAD family phosphatase [Candidatus Melainabacteria bacterium]|nr:MAG: HAD family phosphatase [Candidatus Melainabacteria bacterium]